MHLFYVLLLVACEYVKNGKDPTHVKGRSGGPTVISIMIVSDTVRYPELDSWEGMEWEISFLYDLSFI
jgi:hypothetical protein